MPRQPAAPAARQSIGIRPRTELKQALEKIAAENGRSLAQEVERRLEHSLEDSPQHKQADPLPGIFSEETRAALRASIPYAHLVEAVADVLNETIRAAKARGRDEIEIRTAARAALNAVADQYLWRGEQTETPVEGPQPALGAHVRDYPPGALGYEIARHRLLWLSLWHDNDAAADKMKKWIRDQYSGDGKDILFGPSYEETARIEAEIKASIAKSRAEGTLEDELEETMSKYKPTGHWMPTERTNQIQGNPPVPQSLKDLSKP